MKESRFVDDQAMLASIQTEGATEKDGSTKQDLRAVRYENKHQETKTTRIGKGMKNSKYK